MSVRPFATNHLPAVRRRRPRSPAWRIASLISAASMRSAAHHGSDLWGRRVSIMLTRAAVFVATLIAGQLPLTEAALAQSPQAADSIKAAAIASLRAGARVRVDMFSGERLDGFVRRASGDTLVMSSAHGERVVPRAVVATLWEGRGSRARSGAISGAVAGAVLGGGAGILLGPFMCENSCGRDRIEGGIGGALIGAAIGVLAGSVVGALASDWHQRFP